MLQTSLADRLAAPLLPLRQVFVTTWQAGGPGLHRPLDKLLATWAGVFPQHLLADIHGRLGALRAAAASAQVQPPAGYGYAGAPPQQQQQQQRYALQAPAQFQPAGGFYQQQQQAPVRPLQQLGLPAGFAAPQPAPQPAAQIVPQPAMQPTQQQPTQQQPNAPVNVTDLLSSLMSAGLLAAPGAQPAAGTPSAGVPLAPGGGTGPPLQQHAAPPAAPRAGTMPPPEREQPPTTTFAPERLKVLAWQHRVPAGGSAPRRRPPRYFRPAPSQAGCTHHYFLCLPALPCIVCWHPWLRRSPRPRRPLCAHARDPAAASQPSSLPVSPPAHQQPAQNGQQRGRPTEAAPHTWQGLLGRAANARVQRTAQSAREAQRRVGGKQAPGNCCRSCLPTICLWAHPVVLNALQCKPVACCPES